MNPYYDYEKLGWEVNFIEDDDLCYEFDILCFWRTKDYIIYSADDSGCSCPTPFEDYMGDDAEEISQQLERVGSYKQAIQIIDSWNKLSDRNKTDSSEFKQQLRKWFVRE